MRVPVLSYSDWQIRLLRDALAAHRLYSPGKNGRFLTWLELTADVEVYTDVALGKDLLRQFVEGVSKRNPGKRREPEPATLDTIAAYLTDSDLGALSEDELKNERAPAYQAPLRLLQYLKQDLDTETLNPPPSLSGSYQARCTLKDGSPATVTVSMDCTSGGPLIALTETLVRYYREDRIPDRRRDQAGSENLRKHSRGWAILTPEDNLFAFMKEEPYGYNHYYLSFAVESDLWSMPAVNRFVLLRHAYPLEFDTHDTSPEAALYQPANLAQDNLLRFARIT